MFFITPSMNGHFQNYISIFKEKNEYQGHILINSNIFSSILTLLITIFNLRRKKEVKEIIFLHGEKHFFISLFASIIWTRILGRKTKSIFYYGYTGKKKGLKKRLLLLSLLLIKHSKLKAFYLELPKNSFEKEFVNYFKKLNDPILILPNLTSKYEVIKPNSLNFLIAGYLDSRKCLPETITTLKKLIDNGICKTINLVLLGVQNQDFKSQLSKVTKNNSLNIIEKNYRFNDSDLVNEIQSANIILAIYDNHLGSSGIVINAVSYYKPIVFVSTGVCDEFSHELELKERLYSNHPDEIYAFLNKLITSQNAQYSHDSFIRFIEKRTPENFIETISKE